MQQLKLGKSLRREIELPICFAAYGFLSNNACQNGGCKTCVEEFLRDFLIHYNWIMGSKFYHTFADITFLIEGVSERK